MSKQAEKRLLETWVCTKTSDGSGYTFRVRIHQGTGWSDAQPVSQLLLAAAHRFG